MHPAAGIAIMLGAGAVAVAIGGPLRERLPRYGVDGSMALAGACIGVGGLLLIKEVQPASWIAAPALVAVIAVLQVRALFVRGGPFRT